jgi:hypothetical protein
MLSGKMIRIITISLGAVLLVAASLFANHYIPFQFEVFVVYLGIVLFVAGLASLIKPFRFLHIKNRKSAVLLTGAGLLVLFLGMKMPAPMIHSGRAHQRIDDFMPVYQF